MIVDEQDPRSRSRGVVACVDGLARGLVHRRLELGGRVTELPEDVRAEHEELGLERPVDRGPNARDRRVDEGERLLLFAGAVERRRLREGRLGVVDHGASRRVGGRRVDRGEDAHVRAVVDGGELRDGGPRVVHGDTVGLRQDLHERARLPALDVQAASAKVEDGLGLILADARRRAALGAHRDPPPAHPVERLVDHVERRVRVRRVRRAEGSESPARSRHPEAL